MSDVTLNMVRFVFANTIETEGLLSLPMTAMVAVSPDRLHVGCGVAFAYAANPSSAHTKKIAMTLNKVGFAVGLIENESVTGADLATCLEEFHKRHGHEQAYVLSRPLE